MLAFPSMLVQACIDEGIPTPHDPDEYDPELFPQFHLFCIAQLGRPMSPGAHWENAKVIAAIPPSEVKTITFEQLTERGWVI